MTVANITSGFRSSGIFPLKAGIFTNADVTDRPQTVVNEQDDLIQLSQVHLSQLYSRFQSTIQARLVLLAYWQGLPLRILLLHWWWLPLSSLLPLMIFFPYPKLLRQKMGHPEETG